jgi:hypothetical protein
LEFLPTPAPAFGLDLDGFTGSLESVLVNIIGWARHELDFLGGFRLLMPGFDTITRTLTQGGKGIKLVLASLYFVGASSTDACMGCSHVLVAI